MKGLLVASAVSLGFIGCGTTTYVAAPDTAARQTISCGDLYEGSPTIHVAEDVRASGISCKDSLVIVGAAVGGKLRSGGLRVRPEDRYGTITNEFGAQCTETRCYQRDLDHVEVRTGKSTQPRTYSYYAKYLPGQGSGIKRPVESILISENRIMRWSGSGKPEFSGE